MINELNIIAIKNNLLSYYYDSSIPPNPSQSITIAFPSLISINSGHNQRPLVQGLIVAPTLNPKL